jgi:uncharacterized membrane protein YvbJ
MSNYPAQFHPCPQCSQPCHDVAAFCQACGHNQQNWQRQLEMRGFEDRLARKTAVENDRLARQRISEMYEPFTWKTLPIGYKIILWLMIGLVLCILAPVLFQMVFGYTF